MPATKARIKFKLPIPWPTERRMVTELGFVIFSRNAEWIIFEKRRSPFKVVADNTKQGLTPAQEARLQGRIDTICSHFGDPADHQPLIRTRLNNIARTLPTDEREFIETWMAANLKGS